MTTDYRTLLRAAMDQARTTNPHAEGAVRAWLETRNEAIEDARADLANLAETIETITLIDSDTEVMLHLTDALDGLLLDQRVAILPPPAPREDDYALDVIEDG